MKFVDLSHPVSNTIATYPTDPEVSIIREKEIDTDNTLLHSFKMGTHTGTHLDVPAHVIPGGKTVDSFPLSSFTGTAVKVNKTNLNSMDQIEDEIDGVIYETGWYRHFNDAKVFYGSDRPQIPEKLIEKILELKIFFLAVTFPAWMPAARKKSLYIMPFWNWISLFMNPSQTLISYRFSNHLNTLVSPCPLKNWMAHRFVQLGSFNFYKMRLRFA